MWSQGRVRGASSSVPGRALALVALLVPSLSACLVVDEDDLYEDELVGEEEQAVTASNLGGANLGGANLGGANLGGANLGGANLGGVNLGGANLGGANLGGTNLGGANLGGANLGGANLGGANLGGANLGGANLSGINLSASTLNGGATGSYAGLGCPVTGTVRMGTDLAATTVGVDIHNLGAAANKMLRSGEDVFTRAQACVVVGIGSTALAKLVSQNSGATLYAAVGKTPWGVASAAGGPIALQAWEVLVWGSARYSSFIVLTPPSTDWAGVAGFVKAVWRWTAAPSKTLKIGQIGGGQAVQTHTGMMGAGAHVLSGAISHRVFVAGLLSFVTATTNNQSVSVDFASAVSKVDGKPLILGNVSGAPIYHEGAYVAAEKPDGAVGITVHGGLWGNTMSTSTVLVADSLLEVQSAKQQFPAAQSPVPRRCAGWKALASLGVTPPAGVCDDGVAFTLQPSYPGAARAWHTIGPAQGVAAVLPYNQRMADPAFLGGVAVTYIHVNDPAFDIPGRTDWVFHSWVREGHVDGAVTLESARIHVASHVTSPTASDWVGLFATNGADTAPLARYHVSSCAATPGSTAFARRSCEIVFDPRIIAIDGHYHLRLFRNGVKVATSPTMMSGYTLKETGLQTD